MPNGLREARPWREAESTATTFAVLIAAPTRCARTDLPTAGGLAIEESAGFLTSHPVELLTIPWRLGGNCRQFRLDTLGDVAAMPVEALAGGFRPTGERDPSLSSILNITWSRLCCARPGRPVSSESQARFIMLPVVVLRDLVNSAPGCRVAAEPGQGRWVGCPSKLPGMRTFRFQS